jgi:hypothetical protein
MRPPVARLSSVKVARSTPPALVSYRRWRASSTSCSRSLSPTSRDRVSTRPACSSPRNFLPLYSPNSISRPVGYPHHAIPAAACRSHSRSHQPAPSGLHGRALIQYPVVFGIFIACVWFVTTKTIAQQSVFDCSTWPILACSDVLAFKRSFLSCSLTYAACLTWRANTSFFVLAESARSTAASNRSINRSRSSLKFSISLSKFLSLACLES